MFELLLIALAWFAGGFINGIAGFGAAMVAMPLIAPYIDFSLAVPSCTIIVLLLNVQVGWIFRHDVEWRYVKGIFWGAIPGTLLSAFVLESVPENCLKAAMGSFITLYAVWSLLSDRGGHRIIHAGWGYLAGLLSAALGMAFGFNGPPLAAYTAYSGCPARAVKGVLGVGFILTGIGIVAAKAGTGQVNQQVVLTVLAAVPAVLAGSRLGITVSSFLSEYSYRKVLFIALGVMGINIVVSTLRSSGLQGLLS